MLVTTGTHDLSRSPPHLSSPVYLSAHFPNEPSSHFHHQRILSPSSHFHHQRILSPSSHDCDPHPPRFARLSSTWGPPSPPHAYYQHA